MATKTNEYKVEKSFSHKGITHLAGSVVRLGDADAKLLKGFVEATGVPVEVATGKATGSKAKAKSGKAVSAGDPEPGEGAAKTEEGDPEPGEGADKTEEGDPEPGEGEIEIEIK